jgi:hydroxymethylbilane synthase
MMRLGTRGSALARAQAEAVAASLREIASVPVELAIITTSGDRSQRTNQPSSDWGSGVFVKELEAALRNRDIDLAVHSLKDVPPDVASDLALAAIPSLREDPRDALVTRDGRRLADLATGARVGTSSARRAAFLRAARPDLVILPLRGNVDTRCRKLAAGEYDAIVVARAGLVRLDLDMPNVPLDAAVMPPAPGQGALVIETRADDEPARRLVEKLHGPETAAAVTAERRVMTLLGGGCQLPIGALATPGADHTLHLLGAVAAVDGSRVIHASAVGEIGAPEALAENVAASLVEQGAHRMLAAPMVAS